MSRHGARLRIWAQRAAAQCQGDKGGQQDAQYLGHLTAYDGFRPKWFSGTSVSPTAHRILNGPIMTSPTTPELTPEQTIALCREAHRRLERTVAKITDEIARRPSLLPGWTVGHVLAHTAQNADGHTRRLAAALEGKEVARYPGGQEQRNRDIQQAAPRPAAELNKEITASNQRLEEIWQGSVAAGWPNAQLLAGDKFRTDESPLRRLREVEVHHVDLNLGYRPEDWPDEYLAWELPLAVAGVPDRLQSPADAKRLLAWLIGRAKAPPDVELKPWL